MIARDVRQIRKCVIEKLITEHFEPVIFANFSVLSDLPILRPASFAPTYNVKFRLLQAIIFSTICHVVSLLL